MFGSNVNAQFIPADAPIGKWYSKLSNESIFSSGSLKIKDVNVDSEIRYSAFFHGGVEMHYNFFKVLGMNTGLMVRNVGFINNLNDSIKLKQRSYALGIPLFLNIRIKNGLSYISFGPELECMFAYKQKVIHDDEKLIYHEWFSNKVQLFNPSLNFSVHMRDLFVRVKYYTRDFLDHDHQSIKVNGQRFLLPVTESKLFYISIGRSMGPFNRKIRHSDAVESSY